MAGPVRHPIDRAALEAYLAHAAPEIDRPLTVAQFGYGQSNPTYQLTTPSGRRYVLRKKPPGRLVSQTAHKVEREYRVLAALGRANAGLPIPRALCLCQDAAVVGTPFYVMDFVDGRILTDPALPTVGADTAARRAMWTDAVCVLARLHRVDVARVGLDRLGRPTGFYARQVATWTAICTAQAAAADPAGQTVGALPHFADLVAYFADAAAQPADRSALVHGDYKMDNLVFHPTEPRVVGILDWEMSTRGHPLSDLLNLLTPYYTAPLHGTIQSAHAGFLPGATPGLPTLDEVVALYAAEAGWTPDPAALCWAAAFNIFRLAAICQGIAARVATRQASSDVAHAYAAAREPLARLAWDLVQQVPRPASPADTAKL